MAKSIFLNINGYEHELTITDHAYERVSRSLFRKYELEDIFVNLLTDNKVSEALLSYPVNEDVIIVSQLYKIKFVVNLTFNTVVLKTILDDSMIEKVGEKIMKIMESSIEGFVYLGGGKYEEYNIVFE